MILLVVVDSVWIVGGRNIHNRVITKVQKSAPELNVIPAILFYVLAAAGYVFIVKKLARTDKEALMYGVLLGLLMYGTFDLTNKAIFKDYPWYYTITDMAWGTFCMGLVSFLVFRLNF
jgi:uncharacterized membrane protein